MKIAILIAVLFILFFSISAVSAKNYSIEFNQVEDKVVVRESSAGLNSSYVDSSMLEKTSGGYYFVKRIDFNESYNNVEIKLNLDYGFVLDKENIYPSGYEIQSDGVYISVIWKLDNVKAGESFPMFIKINDTSNNFSWVYFIFGIILLMLIYLGYGKFYKPSLANKKNSKTNNRKNKNKVNKIDYTYLLDEERKIIELLKKADRHGAWQRNIQANLNLSKAKTSRLVRNLETRNLVKKIPFGNTNKVVLK